MDCRPNLIIPGVAKAGTTSLFAYLAQHPEVCPADEKELNYFSLLPRTGSLPPLDEYVGHFSHCGGEPYRMEASPEYWWRGEQVAPAIAAALPDVRVVVMLRDPVARLWSAYTYLRSMGRLPATMSCDDFITDCERRTTRREGADEYGTTPLAVGLYADRLSVWLDVFGDRLTVVFAEDLFGDPAGTVARLAAWLEIDPRSVAEIDFEVRNETVAPRSLLLARLAWTTRSRLLRAGIRRADLRRRLQWAYRLVNAGQRSERLGAETRHRLERFYADSNRRTAALLRAHGIDRAPAWLGAGGPERREASDA